MAIEQFGREANPANGPRSTSKAMMRGLAGKCPSCGQTKLFESGLKVRDQCSNCGEELCHHRADDLPAYLNIFVVGHIVVALAMYAVTYKLLGTWAIVTLASLLAVAIAILLMRPLKGLVVGAQWAMRMHGFGGDHD